MELRLLRLGDAPTWLPHWKGNRLLLGSAPTSDFPMPGLLPFHALVEACGGSDFVVVHDLARRGDVRDAKGNPVGAAGSRVALNERFTAGAHAFVVVVDASVAGSSEPEASTRTCAVCGATKPAHGRTLGAHLVCSGCLGVVDVPPDACPGYELVARLGSGAMGAVYLALSRAGDVVAVKLLRPSSGAPPSPPLVARFQREIRVLAQLKHPSIVRVLDAGQASGRFFLVSEFVPGGDALARVRRAGPLPPAFVARLGVALADALAHAHQHGVVHRDVKPANVLIEANGNPKLSDFGLAKELAVDDLAVNTGSNAVLGTMSYAAPEQLRDARSAGPPADVFGLGATLYHLVTGRPPRENVSLAEIGKRKFEAAPPPAMSVVKTIPRELSNAIDRALRGNPAERPTPQELKRLLGAMVDTLGGA